MTLTKIFNNHLLKACGTNNILQKALTLDPKKAEDEIYTPELLLGKKKKKKLQARKNPRLIL